MRTPWHKAVTVWRPNFWRPCPGKHVQELNRQPEQGNPEWRFHQNPRGGLGVGEARGLAEEMGQISHCCG